MTTLKNNSIKLLHITTVGMSFNFFRGQISYMKSLGFDIHTLSSPDDFIDEFSKQEQIQHYPVSMLRKISPLRDVIAICKIWFWIIKLRPTIVHSHTPKGGLLGMISSWLAGTPVRVYHIRGLPFMTATGYKRRLLWLSEKVSCMLSHQVICVSHSIRDVSIKEGLCESEKIKVLMGGSSNGVDALKRFNPERISASVRSQTRENCGIPEDSLVLGFVGRIAKEKGIVELAEAWKIIRTEFSSIHLILVGMIEKDAPVPAQTIQSLQEDPRVHFTGKTWETTKFYAAMDLVALPTYREGFPNVPLEAASMALPIVATSIPGCTDAIINNQTGLLVEPYDSESLANAIRTYVKDSALRQKHGQCGRERTLREFAQEGIWKALSEEYTSLLAKKAPQELKDLRKAKKESLPV